MRNSALFCLFLIVIAGCQSPEEKATVDDKDNILRLDIVSAIENKVELKASDIASDIRYIPLETKSANRLKQIYKLQLTENFIFVCDANGLYKFTADGKFVKKIGSSGRGPGEYSSILNFSVREKANTIFVAGEYQAIKYDLEGRCLETYKRPPGITLEFLEKDRMVFYKNNNINRPVNLVVTTLDLEPVRVFYNYNPKPATNWGRLAAPLYSYNNEVYFKENWNDTVFCLHDSILIPYIIINEEDLLLEDSFGLESSSSLESLIAQLDKIDDKLISFSISESERFVFLEYHKGMNPRKPQSEAFVYDKKKRTTLCIKDGIFRNDIDGGIDIYSQLAVDPGVLIQWVDAFKLKAHLNSDEFIASGPLYPEKKEGLKSLGESLKEDDNPVLMLLQLN